MMTNDELKTAKDYVRLNAKKLTDIYPLLSESIYELFGLVLEFPELERGGFRLIQVCNYHGAPLTKKINWGGYDKDYPTEFPGWEFMNTRGTFRTKDGKEVTDKYIREQIGGAYDNWNHRSFWTTGILNWFNGINTGTFNGGSNFMGCFRFFLEDFPHLEYNTVNLFKKEDIIKTYKIKDWDLYLRQLKIKSLLENGEK